MDVVGCLEVLEYSEAVLGGVMGVTGSSVGAATERTGVAETAPEDSAT